MTVRLIPERTVDSMFAIEVVEFVSHALIWSPTNTAGQVDHYIYGLRGVAVPFEIKGVITNSNRDPHRPWRSPIDYRQLQRYVHQGLPVLYVIPGRPDPFRSPWIRDCTHDPDPTGRCLACSNAHQGARRWAGQDRPAIKTAPLEMRAQPWFAHWCWVISAVDLDAHLQWLGSPGGLNVGDAGMMTMPGAERLCHFLAGLSDGTQDVAGIGIDIANIVGMLAEMPARQPEDVDDQSVMTVILLPVAADAP